MATKRAEQFLAYLAAQELLNNTTPTYGTSPNLRKRGIEGRPDLQTRQYAAPSAPPPARANFVGMSNNAPYDPIMDAMMRAPINIMDPGDTVANQFRVANDPMVAEQVGGRKEEWLQRGVEAFLGAAAMGAGEAASTVADIPIGPQGTIMGPGGPIVADPYTATEGATDVVSGVNNVYSIPREKSLETEIQLAIEMSANGGEMPLWGQLLYGDVPGTGWTMPMPTLGLDHDGLRPTIDPHIMEDYAPLGSGDSNMDKLALPSYLESHPEKMATVNEIVAQAEATGQDPNQAVLAWWQEEQGLAWQLGSDVIMDPVNLAGGLGWMGRGLRGAGELKAATQGTSALTKTMEIGGQIIEVPATLIDSPWELGRALRRRGGFGAGNVAPGENILPTKPITEGGLLNESTGSQLRTAQAQVENLLAGGVNTNPNLYGVGPSGSTGPMGPGGAGTGTAYGPTGPLPPTSPPPGATAGPTPLPGSATLPPVSTATGGPLGEAYQEVAGLLNRSPLPATLTDLDNGIPGFNPATGVTPELVGPTSAMPSPRVVETVGPTSAVQAPDIMLSRPNAVMVPRAIYNADTLNPSDVLPDVPEIITPSQDALPESVALDQAPAPVQGVATPDVEPPSATTELPIETDAPRVPSPVRDPATISTLIPPSYTMDGGPRNFITTGPIDNDRMGWSMMLNSDRQQNAGMAFAKEQVDTQFPAQVAAVDEAMTPFMVNVYEPNHAAARNNGWSGQGMPLTARPILEGEAWARYRLALREQGIDTSTINWRKNPERQLSLKERKKAGTARQGDLDKTVTNERYMEDYLFDRTPDPATVKLLNNRKVLVETITDYSNPLQVEGHWRYKEAQKLRRVIHATDEELDTMLGKVDITPQPEPLTEAQITAMPTAEDFQSRMYGGVPGAATQVINDMGPEIANPIIREVTPWAEGAYRNYDVMPRGAQVLTDLEYAGRLRAAALRAGQGDIANLIPAYGNANSLDELAIVDTDGYEVIRNLADERGKYAYDFEAMNKWDETKDYQDWLEDLGFNQGNKFRAKVESIRASNRIAKAGKTGIKTPVPKAVYADKIGLKGWVFEGGDNLQDAMRVLDQAGVPKVMIPGRVTAREADRLINPTEDLIHRAIVGSDEAAREARSALYKRDDVPFFAEPPSSSATDPAARAWEQRGYDLNQQIYATRTMLRGTPENAIAVADNYGRPLTRADWVIEQVDGGFVARNPITGQTSKTYKTKATVQNWVNKFPETDDGTWLTAPECFI